MEKGVVLGDRISEILGRRHSRSTIVSSASLAILCLFYAYTVGTFLQVRIYPLIDRVTYYIPFNFYIVNEFVDHIVIGTLLILWLALSVRHRIGYIVFGVFAALFVASAATNYDAALDGIAISALPAIAAIMIYDRYASRKILQSRLGLVKNYLAIIGIITGLISLGFAISSIAFPSDNGMPVMRSYAHDIFLLFSSFSPVLLLLLITCYPVKLLIDYIKTKARQPLQPAEIVQKQVSTRAKVTCLSLFVLLSIVIAIIPHLPTVNKDDQQVGVDTGFYVNWVGGLNESANPSEFLYQAFVEQRGGDRSVSLMLIFGLQKITNSDLFSVVEYLPLILGPALVLAVYFLTRELTLNDTTSLFAAFLTAISFHVLIGIYAGFYANWLALIFGYVSFAFLFRFLRGGDKRNLVLYAAFLALTLFTHVHTWSILAIVSGIFLIVMMKVQYYNRRNLVLLLAILFSTIIVDIAKTNLTGSLGGIDEDIALAESFVGPEQFVLRWNNLSYTVTTFFGGLFANFIILGLGIYWLYKANMKKPLNIFLIIFLSIGMLPFLFGEWLIQSRTFYNIPFQIPAAMALFQIGNSQLSVKSLPLFIWLMAMAIIGVSNFYWVTPLPTG